MREKEAGRRGGVAAAATVTVVTSGPCLGPVGRGSDRRSESLSDETHRRQSSQLGQAELTQFGSGQTSVSRSVRVNGSGQQWLSLFRVKRGSDGPDFTRLNSVNKS
ncbi:hypothetical protein Hanom_Chr03g00198371 [Helianthus anomalus]